LGTASNWLWNFLIVSLHTPLHTIFLDPFLTQLPGASQAFFTPFITREINYGYGFVFAGCNLAAAVFTYFFLYESSGISLEMIDAMYSEPGLKPWQSGKWAPEVSRHDPGVLY
jgi:SP family sugar:H+ symporter-like MFS transporter